MEDKTTGTLQLPSNSKLNSRIVEELHYLLEATQPGRLRRHLQYIFLSFLSHEYETVPIPFRQMTEDMLALLEFLDKIEDCINQGLVKNEPAPT